MGRLIKSFKWDACKLAGQLSVLSNGFVRGRRREVVKACFGITLKFTSIEMLRKAEYKTLFGRRNRW